MKTTKLPLKLRNSIAMFCNIAHGLKFEALVEYAEEKNLGVPPDLRPHLARLAKEEIAYRAQAK